MKQPSKEEVKQLRRLKRFFTKDNKVIPLNNKKISESVKENPHGYLRTKEMEIGYPTEIDTEKMSSQSPYVEEEKWTVPMTHLIEPKQVIYEKQAIGNRPVLVEQIIPDKDRLGGYVEIKKYTKKFNAGKPQPVIGFYPSPHHMPKILPNPKKFTHNNMVNKGEYYIVREPRTPQKSKETNLKYEKIPNVVYDFGKKMDKVMLVGENENRDPSSKFRRFNETFTQWQNRISR